jgi:hypothetical protein
MKTSVFLTLCLLLIFSLPVSAQIGTSTGTGMPPESYVPADFAGFIRARVDVADAFPLQIAAVAAYRLQPSRVNIENFQGYDSLFPMDILDVEGATFSVAIQPWVNRELVIAYRTFEEGLTTTSENVLLILPVDDVTLAATFLAPVLQLQDHLERTTYRDVSLHIGDKAAFAFAPEVVFIGAEEVVKEALDVRTGVGERLIDQSNYQTVSAASPDNTMMFAYMGGENARTALSLLLNVDVSAEPLLQALGETLQEAHRNEGTFEAALLTSAIDAIGVSVVIDDLPLLPGGGFVSGPEGRPVVVRFITTFYTADKTQFNVDTSFDESVLNMIPQNAMVVQSGGNARGALYDALYALPLANFAGRILGAFPVPESVGSVNELVTVPSAADLERSVNGFLSVLENVGDFQLTEDLLRHFTGSYTVALLPRPNNPTPVLNTPFDLLVVAEVDEGSLVVDNLTRLIELLSPTSEFEDETISETAFRTLRQVDTGEVVLRLGVVDGMLVIATGSSLEPALQAWAGDNRLIDRERWLAVSEDAVPHLFVNLDSIFNVFFQIGGTPIGQQVNVLAARGQQVADGLYQLQVMMTLPTS